MNGLTPDLETYVRFLGEVLRAIHDSNGDAEVVHRLLARNIDKLDDNFDEILFRWATNTLEKAEPEAAESIAGIISTFSTLIYWFPLGNKAVNIEIAITGYLIALKIYTSANFPQYWANTQNNLGITFSQRIRGDKTENLEMAIAALYDALLVRIRADFPQEWATTQLNLGGVYIERIKGNKADNLEQAITALANAEHIFNRTDFPQEWANIQNNLGAAYKERIEGNKADNLEQAIAALSNALQVLTCNNFPQRWADAQNNLGVAYRHRIKGDKADNLEKAIAAYSAALKIYTRIDFPRNWADVQNNLGLAHIDRIKGDKADNLEQAITALANAEHIFTHIDPQAWADVQNNLGNAYRLRIRGDKADNLEQAILYYCAALDVRTRTNFPQTWAETQNNLGNAYTERIKGDKADNLEQAIAAFSNALDVRTPSNFRQAWAETQNNLGLAYAESYRISKGDKDKDDNLKNAIAAYSNALRVRTYANFPEKYAETSLNLGLLYSESDQHELAESTLTSAIDTVENLRDEIISGEESKDKQSEKWNGLFRLMVEVCLSLGKEVEAIEYVERSKTRNLVESILNRDIKTIFSSEKVAQLDDLQEKINSDQSQLQNGEVENPTALAEELKKLRQERINLQDGYLPIGSRFTFDRFQSNLDNSTAIIEWYITLKKIIAFVIVKPQGQKIPVWQSQPQDLDDLINWSNEYLIDYYRQKEQWQNQLEKRLKKLAEILHIEEILTHIPKRDRLILIPHQYLHLFPIHALPVGKSYLLDLFPNGVGYAPSCQILQQVQKRKRPDFESLFAIQTPTADLYEKDLGAVAAIKTKFADAKILKQDEAKKSAILLGMNENPNSVKLHEKLLKANCIFFFCHGYFNPNSPLDSGLQLADDNLTLADIIAHFKLDNCRLVTLSACETGVTDFTSISDVSSRHKFKSSAD